MGDEVVIEEGALLKVEPGATYLYRSRERLTLEQVQGLKRAWDRAGTGAQLVVFDG